MTKGEKRYDVVADVDRAGKWLIRLALTVWIPLVLVGLGVIPYRFFGFVICGLLVYVAVIAAIAMQPAPVNRRDTALASHGKQFDRGGEQ